MVDKRRAGLFFRFAPILLGAVAFFPNVSAFAETIEIPFKPKNHIIINVDESLTVDYADFLDEENDPTKAIILNGGCLTYANTTSEARGKALLLGVGSETKDFIWGKGGEINVANSDSGLAICRSCTGMELTKSGAGQLQLLTTDATSNTQYFGKLTVKDGTLYVYGYDLGEATKSVFWDPVVLGTSQEENTNAQLIICGDGKFYKSVRLDNQSVLTLREGNFDFQNIVFNNASFMGIIEPSSSDETYSVNFSNVYYGKERSSYLGDSGSNTSFQDVYLYSRSGISNKSNSKLTFNNETYLTDRSYLLIHGQAELNGTSYFGNSSRLFISDGAEVKVNNYLQFVCDAGLHMQKGGALNFAPDVNLLIYKDAFVDTYGKTEFEGNNIIAVYGGQYFAGNDVVYGQGTYIDLGEGYGGSVHGYASGLKTDVLFSDFYGTLSFDDSYALYDPEQELTKVVENPVFYTEDEARERTYLIGNGIKESLEDAEAQDQIFSNRLVSQYEGYGNIRVHSYADYTQEEYTPGLVSGVNGYAVIFGDSEQNQLFTQYSGWVEEKFGTFALKGGTVFGADSSVSKFTVYGQSYNKNDELSEKFGRNIYETESSGVLAFYRGDENDPNVAPTLNVGQLVFSDGVAVEGASDSILGGARLWLDASYDDSKSDRKLGTINADAVFFGEHTCVWYDGISTVDSDAELTFDLNAPDLVLISGDKYYVADKDVIESIFGDARLVDATYETDGAGKGTVTVKARNVADYASDMTQKERDYAAKLDANRITPNADTPFYDALYNETDEGKVRQTIHNLSIGGYQMLNAYGHFGNPTSSFFGGSTISAEHKRAQSIDDEYDPSYGNGEQPRRQSAIADAPVDNSSRAIWGAYTNTTIDGDEYDNDGMTMNGYHLRRQGIVGGLRRQIDGSTSGGLFFGLSNPEIDSNGQIQGGYGNYGSHMEMDDFQFAGHFEKVVGDFWEISAYVGGGTQAMDWRRDLYLNEGGRYQFKADGTGNTLTGTLYLANRIDLSDNLTFRPTVGVDSEHSWIYGFNEIQTIGGTVDEVNTYMRWLAQSYAYDQTYYNRNTARAGARVNWDGHTGVAGLNAQAFYAVKLGGKASPLISYRSENYSFDNMETHAMGGESFSVGGGGFLNLNRAKTLTATGDFNAVWYKNATTQNVTGGLTYRF